MNKSSLNPFRPDFTWGSATAAYQVEGAFDADGKGLSVWDQFSHTPGKVYQSDNGDTACDHYHRMESDVALMSEFGLQAYRFSLSWPRIMPQGRGEVNAAGLDFYDRLVDALLARNIVPWATLFHWDYPLELYREGGWMNPDSPAWFADYTAVVADKLGDRVRHWMTLNEPQIFVTFGHKTGTNAPGLALPVPDIVRIAHNVLLAHGRAVQTLRSVAAVPSTIGWAPAVGVHAVAPHFASDPEVVQHARDGLFGVPDPDDFSLGAPVWNDAALLGRYPEAYVRAQARYLPAGWEADLAVIKQPLDFCGMNIYAAGWHHTRDAQGKVICRPESQLGPGYPRTLFGWPVTPEALYWGPRFFHERYGVPIVITENGMSGHDWVALDGKVHDAHRIDFTARYLRELRRASSEGVDVRGYFHWSFLDNFEWAEGYKHRFGLVHVDGKTLVRTPKDSAYWYRDVIASNGRLIGSGD
jgi:beta-glucosidase